LAVHIRTVRAVVRRRSSPLHLWGLHSRIARCTHASSQPTHLAKLVGRIEGNSSLLFRTLHACHWSRAIPWLIQRWAFSFLWKKTVFLQIVDVFHDKIQNAAYSYSGSWLLAGQDEGEDAAFVKLGHTEDALPGFGSLAEGSQEWCRL
jgi:hypothetical protein